MNDWESLAAIQERSYSRASRALLSSYPRKHTMNAAELSSFLGKKKYAVLATTRPDGRAHAAIVGFTVWRGAFWVASVEGTKVRNLRSKPWASIVIFEGEPPVPHQAVMAEGPANVHAASVLGTLGPLAERWDERHGRKPDWASALIELTPETLFSYDARRVGEGGREGPGIRTPS